MYDAEEYLSQEIAKLDTNLTHIIRSQQNHILWLIHGIRTGETKSVASILAEYDLWRMKENERLNEKLT
jgi:hypothetical protein